MLQAVGTKLVIEKIEEEQKSAMGIVLSNAGDPNPKGKILSIGEDVKAKLNEGDMIFVEWRNTASIKSMGQTYYICDITGVYAVEK